MAKFKDTKGHWAEDTIDEMADKGILNGYPDGTFRPNENMTRAQVAVVAKMIMDKLAK